MKTTFAIIAIASLALPARAQLGPGSVGTRQLQDNAVTAPKIANGSITAAKLAPGAVGGGTWGSITGTLANQTDLWAALNGKAATNGANAAGTWPISISGNAATATNGLVSTGSYADPAWLTSVSAAKLTGVVSVGNLGTGTANNGAYLRGDGTWTAANWLTSASTLDATKLTGTVAVANGGTGATTAAGARTALGAASLGANTFTGAQTAIAYATTRQTLTDAASIAWDASLGAWATVTLGGNRTLANPTNLTAGGRYVARVVQDGTGGRTLAFGANYKFPGAVAPAISNTAGSVTILEFISWDGSTLALTNAVFDVK